MTRKKDLMETVNLPKIEADTKGATVLKAWMETTDLRSFIVKPKPGEVYSLRSIWSPKLGLNYYVSAILVDGVEFKRVMA